MTHNQQQYEQDIDAALDILRSAQPASADPVSSPQVPGQPHEAFAAMNARLLHNLRARESCESQSPLFRRAWFSLPRLAFATAAVAAVVVFLLLPRLRSGPVQTGSVAISHAPAMTPSSRRKSTEPQPNALRADRVRPAKQAGFPTAPLNSRASVMPTSPQSIGLDPAFLPSQPAPEEPLTHQERLLLSMVHRRKPLLLALLGAGEPGPLVPRQPTDANPFLAGFQPEPQPATQSGAQPDSQSGSDTDNIPQLAPQF